MRIDKSLILDQPQRWCILRSVGRRVANLCWRSHLIDTTPVARCKQQSGHHPRQEDMARPTTSRSAPTGAGMSNPKVASEVCSVGCWAVNREGGSAGRAQAITASRRGNLLAVKSCGLIYVNRNAHLTDHVWRVWSRRFTYRRPCRAGSLRGLSPPFFGT